MPDTEHARAAHATGGAVVLVEAPAVAAREASSGPRPVAGLL